MILACQRAGYGPGESPPTPRHAHSTTLTHPCSLAPTLPAPAPYSPANFGQHGAAVRSRETSLGTPSSARHPRLIRHARPVLHERFERVRLLLAEHPPPPPAWPGQVHGAAYPGYGASHGTVVRPTGEALHREKGRQWVRARRPTHHVRHRIARRRPPGWWREAGSSSGHTPAVSSGRASHHCEVLKDRVHACAA